MSNAGLVGKVWFPREILPLASIGAAVVHFFLQLIVLFVALLVFRYQPGWGYLWLVIPALITLLVFTAALGIALSAVNVYLRDTSHLLELVLLAWFWMTPIVYYYQQVASRLHTAFPLFLLNPVTPIVITFQRAIYGKTIVPVSGVETSILPDASRVVVPAEPRSGARGLGRSGVLRVLAVRPARGQPGRGALSGSWVRPSRSSASPSASS